MSADPRVRAVIDHWAPRFVAMGVDYNDFVRTTGRIERWEEWLEAWSAVADEHIALARAAEQAGHRRSAGEAYLHAALCLHFGKFVWMLDAAAHRAATERSIAVLYRAHEYLDPSAERVEAVLDGRVLAANLRRPAGIERPPLVLLIPGLDSTKEEFFHHENAFLVRGMATLSMDGPGQGESGFALAIRPDYEVAVGAVLDAVAEREDVDLERVGAVGVSLGGYYAPRAAAFEPRLRAVAGISGSYDFGALWDRLPPLTRETFIVKSGARDDAEGRERAAALSLRGVAGEITQPALFVTGGLDRIVPWRETERMAREAPRGEFVLFEQGSHVCSNMPYRYRPLVADWMLGQLADAMIGRPLRRREDLPLVRGHGRYVDDLDLPGMAHVAFVRTHDARARILGMRVPSSAPGLVRVLTAEDLAGRARSLPVIGPEGADVADVAHPILAGEEVRYAGQPVAAVLAESRAQALDAAELVEVEYEPLDPVIEPRDAPETLLRWERTAGDVEGAFADCTHRVVARYRLPRLVAAPIEPRGVVAAYDQADDLLTVWASVQDPHRPLSQLAHALDRPRESIRVVVPDVGGAFGSKGVIAVEAVAVAVAAMEVGRPLKWIEDRLENFLGAYQGRGVEATVELGLDAAGRLLALRASILADLGAYLLPSTAIPPHTTAMLMTGCYDIPAAAVSIRGARTDKVPTGAYRGAGRPEAAYFLELTVDRAAREIGLDPVELRRRNLIRSWPYRSALGWTYDSGDYERCLDRALELAGPAPSSGTVGTGVAMYVERAGGSWESARIRVGADGRVIAESGSCPHGQGHETTFAQIVADRLGVEPGDVEVRFGDSATVPAGVGTFASRSVAMGGSALLEAADRIVESGFEVAAGLLDCRAEHLTRAGSRWSGPDGRAVTLGEIASAAGSLEAETRFESDLVFGSGAYAAVVEIDRETGTLHVRRLVAVDDAGTIINPLLAEGQVLGGAVQGLGAVLMEEAVHDGDGQPLGASFAAYGLPSAVEVPPIATAFVQTPSPSNPLGAKGIGEGGAIGTPAAIANAVADALGGAAPDPPFTAEKLWRALREADQ